MKKLFFIFFLSINIYNSYSCSCKHNEITQEIYNDYSLIFTGEIVEVEDCDNLGYQKFTFEIEEIFKGQTTKFISGYNNCGGVCNFLYKKGQKWLVYSNPNKYGLINDSYLCNQSITIYNSENRWLSGDQYTKYRENLKFEIDFLKTRKTIDAKIVNYQLIKFIPFLKHFLILGVIISLFLVFLKLKIKILPYSIGIGIVSGILYYSLLRNFFLSIPIKFKIIYIVLIFGFMFISNFIYFLFTKEKVRFKKSVIYNYFSFSSIVITTLYMMVSNEHQEVEYNENFHKTFLFIIAIGIPFSLLVTTILLIGKNIQLRIKK